MSLRDGSESTRITQIFEAARNPAFDILVRGIGHNASSDLPLLIGAEIPGVAGSPIAPPRALEIVRAYCLAFFNEYLKGDRSPLLGARSASLPEAEITVYPQAAAAHPSGGGQ